MYYNSAFNPGIIEISTTNALLGTSFDSYFIEIWYFPDNVFLKTVINTAPVQSPVLQKNHIFYTNVFQIFADGSSSYDYYSLFVNNAVKKVLQVTVSGQQVTLVSKYEWNRIIAQVKYDPSVTTNSYTADLFTKNRLQNNYKFSIGTSSTPLTLSKIVFTHNDQTGSYPNIYWGSGYYRNLRVWNGDQISEWAIFKYND